MSDRLTWDQYFMTITRQVAERSTCSRAKVGAVITRGRSILATGYNGATVYQIFRTRDTAYRMKMERATGSWRMRISS